MASPLFANAIKGVTQSTKTNDNYKERFAILERLRYFRTALMTQFPWDFRGALIVELKLNNKLFKKGRDINISIR